MPPKAGPQQRRTLNQLKREREAGGGKDRKEPPRAMVQVGAAVTAVMLGDDDPRTWTDEEILHGRRADRNGRFTGQDPKVVPREVYDELLRRNLNGGMTQFHRMQDDALEMLQDLMTGEDVDDKVRLAAVKMVLERTMGKTPDRIEIGVTREPWQDAVADVEFVTDDDIVDAEVVE